MLRVLSVFHGAKPCLRVSGRYQDIHKLWIAKFSVSAENNTVSGVHDILSVENELRCSVELKDGVQDQIFLESAGLLSRSTLVNIREKSLEQAAILIPLCVIDNEPSMLFTLRSSLLGSHKGEVSFPGGISDKSDEDIVQTALRETYEEIGLKPDCVNVWGCGASVPSRDLTRLVHPIVASCGVVDLAKLKPNPKEVEEIFHVPLKDLCDTENWFYTRFLLKTEQYGLTKRPSYITPVFTGSKHRIWGLTGMFTYLSLRTVAKGLFQFRIPKN